MPNIAGRGENLVYSGPAKRPAIFSRSRLLLFDLADLAGQIASCQISRPGHRALPARLTPVNFWDMTCESLDSQDLRVKMQAKFSRTTAKFCWCGCQIENSSPCGCRIWHPFYLPHCECSELAPLTISCLLYTSPSPRD